MELKQIVGAHNDHVHIWEANFLQHGPKELLSLIGTDVILLVGIDSNDRMDVLIPGREVAHHFLSKGGSGGLGKLEDSDGGTPQLSSIHPF